MPVPYKTIYRACIGLSLLPLLYACAAGDTRPLASLPRAAPSRGEAVFRLQNAVLDQLIDAQINPVTNDAALARDLARREEGLVDHCAPLNRAAALGASGADPDLLLKLQVLLSLSPCERAALAAREFMARDRAVLTATLP